MSIIIYKKIFSEARAVHESEILYQFLRQSSYSENNSSKKLFVKYTKK